jgi:hypothetical protein
MEKYFEDFNFFWDKINNYQNFSFVRYADGEVMLINGIPVGKSTQAYQIDNWYSDGQNTIIGNDLLSTLKTDNKDFYFAISSKTDNLNDYNFLFNSLNNKNNITFANLWINANYEKHINNIKNLKRNVVLICNEKCDINNVPFNVSKFIPFPDDCVNFWENNKTNFSNTIKKVSSEYSDTLFIICCGPLSAVLIKLMFENNENNTYIDFGSSMDEFIHGKKTRPYMFENTQYSKMISSF